MFKNLKKVIKYGLCDVGKTCFLISTLKKDNEVNQGKNSKIIFPPNIKIFDSFRKNACILSKRMNNLSKNCRKIWKISDTRLVGKITHVTLELANGIIFCQSSTKKKKKRMINDRTRINRAGVSRECQNRGGVRCVCDVTRLLTRPPPREKRFFFFSYSSRRRFRRSFARIVAPWCFVCHFFCSSESHKEEEDDDFDKQISKILMV